MWVVNLARLLVVSIIIKSSIDQKPELMSIYFGKKESYSDGRGHTLLRNQPLSICDKTARVLEEMGRDDLIVTDSTYFYDGGGCC